MRRLQLGEHLLMFTGGFSIVCSREITDFHKTKIVKQPGIMEYSWDIRFGLMDKSWHYIAEPKTIRVPARVMFKLAGFPLPAVLFD